MAEPHASQRTARSAPPDDYTCERCWLEPAAVPAPDGSDLTWTCRECFDALYTTDALAAEVNGGGRSGTL